EGEYAREAFYQDLKYDITASKIITFKDIKIEVDSADQQKIKFTVIKGPDEIEYTTTGNGKTKEIKIGTGKIGITIDADCTIKEIYTNGPAEAAGLMEGDVILQIDGLPAPCKDGQRLLSKITGQPGTEVLLLVSRDGKELSFRVKRKKM
ncbi:MAG: PDZ domain-containing protein, partial [Bacteroidetes bacterium]